MRVLVVYAHPDPDSFTHAILEHVTRALPDELLERANLPEAVMRTARDPVRGYLARRWLRGKSPRDIARAIAQRQPEDVRKQQKLVADAEGLVFVAPVFWMGFPAMLKGWFERVFAYGQASLRSDQSSRRRRAEAARRGIRSHPDGRLSPGSVMTAPRRRRRRDARNSG